MSDLVERLQKLARSMEAASFFGYAETCGAAADHIEQQDKRIAELERIERAAIEAVKDCERDAVGNINCIVCGAINTHLDDCSISTLKDALAKQEKE